MPLIPGLETIISSFLFPFIFRSVKINVDIVCIIIGPRDFLCFQVAKIRFYLDLAKWVVSRENLLIHSMLKQRFRLALKMLNRNWLS